MTRDWSQEFPGLAHGTYLNSCAHGLLPRRARVAADRHLDRWQAEPDWNVWAEHVERARSAFARLIGAREDEVAVQANASTAISAVVSTLRPGVRDTIATSALDFPTAPYIAALQRERGLRHDHAPRLPRLDERTALACIPAVVSFTGERLDTPSYVRDAHEAGVPVLVDAFQAVGTFPIDVRKWDVDFLVTGVYKWLMGASGLAFLYVRRDHHARVPTSGGWMASGEPYAFDPLLPPAPDARRYQYGGASALACATLPESLAVLEEVGLAHVERHNARLVERVIARADERKWEVLTPREAERRASIVTMRVPDLDRGLAACARERVSVNTRLGGIRVSPHFYNADRDVDRLFEVLDAAFA